MTYETSSEQAATASGGAVSASATYPHDITERPQTAIDGVADAFTETLLELDPGFATELGLPGSETEYRDYSPAGYIALAEATQEALDRLSDLEPTDEVDRVTLDAMRERLGLELEIFETGYDLGALNNISSPAQEIRAIFDLMPTGTVQDWDHIAGRLHNVPDAISGYMSSLRTAAEDGVVAAKRQVRTVIEQTAKYAGDGGFFDSLVESAASSGAELSPDLTERLKDGAERAKQAYRNLSGMLSGELLEVAPEADAVGRNYYALMSRRFLGSAVDLDETYQWGIAELDRIIDEQEAVANQISEGASVAEAIAVLDDDPQRQLQGTGNLQQWMQQLSDNAVQELAGTHFNIPDIMKTIECRIAPTQEGGIYYTGPSDDFSRPGRMWWSVPEGEDTFTTWRETTTVYHEGVPGHHLQIGTATYQRGLLNNWRRNACWVSGHGEGWALYAERLMADLGYLDDPGDRLGMLDGQRMRAARVVFDIGVHLGLEMPQRWGSGVWTAEKGYEFLKQNISISEGQLDFEFTRYLGWPGQAPSYKIGQRLWEEIGDTVKEQEGDAFDQREFHTRALNVGSVGLDTLRRALVGPDPEPAEEA